MIAAQEAVAEFTEKLKRKRGHAGAISVIALNNKGEWGIGTNVEFTFAAVSSEDEAAVYIATPMENNKEVVIEKASKEYMENYKLSIQKPIE